MLNSSLLRAKFKASGIHFGLSAIAFGVVLYLILFHWYPWPWFVDGGWQGVRIMVAVDLVLGPVLTLMIFNPAKTRRALTFDFSVIGLIQISAFIWGIYAVHGQRPAAVVFFDGTFYSIEEKVLKKQGQTTADLVSLSSARPPQIFSGPPRTDDERGALIQKGFDGISEYEQTQLFRPLAENWASVVAETRIKRDAVAADPAAQSRLDKLLSKHPGVAPEELVFVRFIGRHEEATLVFTREGRLLGTLPVLDPPK